LKTEVELKKFLQSFEAQKPTSVERGVAVLWWCWASGDHQPKRVREIVRLIEEAGFPAQNGTRLLQGLKKDRRVVGAQDGAFRISARGEPLCVAQFAVHGVAPPPAYHTAGVLPEEVFKDTRGYLERVVQQANASFAYGLFDCCAVMCRRLVETLIIEVYEHLGRSDEIRDADGVVLPLSELIGTIGPDKTIGLSRNAKRGLTDFKRLGDLSAHNRRYNARKSDIENVRDGLRVVTEEMLHLAGLC
jgi:hypothetical protein